MNRKTSVNVHSLVEVALFCALVVVLASVPGLGFIPLGIINATTIHIPVIIASIVIGPKKGAIVGLTFGLTSLIQSTINPSSLSSFVFSPLISGSFYSVIIALVPRILIGVVPYFVYQGIKKLSAKAELPALAVAGFCGSMTNTLLVMNLIYLFFSERYAAAQGIPVDSLYGFIAKIIFVTGGLEAIVAAIISAGVCKSLLYARSRTRHANQGT